MKKAICLVIVLAIMLSPAMAFAGHNFSHKANDRLMFGLKNVAFGWTDLFVEPPQHERFMLGMGKGLSDTVLNTVGGAMHVGTFLVPQMDLPDLPEGGVDMDRLRNLKG